MRLVPTVSLALIASACTVSRPDVDQVLVRDPSSGDAAARLDRRAAAARQRALAAPEDVDAQIAAASILFDVADLRLQTDILRRIAAEDPRTGEALLALEDELEGEIAREVAALSAEGRAFAEIVRALEPTSAAAHHFAALHAAVLTQAEGAVRAVLRVRRIAREIERTVELDPTYDFGAPLLLLGRFRDRAPWPHQDREVALPLLERAAELSPTPARLLYLGDCLFGLGDRFEEAIEAWERASEAPDAPHEPNAHFYRERARARLARERHWLNHGR